MGKLPILTYIYQKFEFYNYKNSFFFVLKTFHLYLLYLKQGICSSYFVFLMIGINFVKVQWIICFVVKIGLKNKQNETSQSKYSSQILRSCNIIIFFFAISQFLFPGKSSHFLVNVYINTSK